MYRKTKDERISSKNKVQYFKRNNVSFVPSSFALSILSSFYPGKFHQGAPKFSSIKQHQLFIISYGFYGSGILWFSHVDLVRVPHEAAAGKWPGLGFSPKVSLLAHLSSGMLWSAE